MSSRYAVFSVVAVLGAVACAKTQFGGGYGSSDKKRDQGSTLETAGSPSSPSADSGKTSESPAGSSAPGDIPSQGPTGIPTPLPAVDETCSTVPRVLSPLTKPLTWTQNDSVDRVPELVMDPTCTGPTYVAFNDIHRAFLAAIQCGGAGKYKLLMAPTVTNMFHEIADGNGHGQDHCELVKPGFSLPNDDEIVSGGCTDCGVGNMLTVLGRPAYLRSCSGEKFEFLAKSASGGDQSTKFYRCGVNIP